jgi:hypothetical protein
VVSSAIIKRIAGEIEGLEQRFKSRRGFLAVFIDCASFSDRDAVLRRHFELYPEQSDPDVIMTTVWPSRISHIDDGEDKQRNTAWRQLAREEMQRYPRGELLCLWGKRAIKDALDKSDGDGRYVVQKVAMAVETWDFPEHQALAMLLDAGITLEGGRLEEAWESGRALAARQQMRMPA